MKSGLEEARQLIVPWDDVFDNPLTLTVELSHATFILLRSILEDDRQARYIINSNILENIIAGRLLLSIVQSPV